MALYAAAGALLLLEIFLRLFDPLGIVYYHDAERYFRAMTPDPDFGYIHTPGYRAELQGVEVSINEEGLRGPAFPRAKPDGEKRLLILGDSVVFGWGAPQDSIFPAVMQETLSETPWRVLAAGVGSWNTRAEYEWLKKRGVHYGIDLLVLVAVANDVEPGAAGERVVSERTSPRVSYPHRVVRRLARYSYAVGTFYHLLRQGRTSHTLTELLTSDSPAWRDARDALDGIIALARELAIPVAVFLYGDFKTDFSRAFNDTYGGYLERQRVPVHVFPREIYAPRYRNSIVDGHPNASAHRLIADHVYRTIAPLL